MLIWLEKLNFLLLLNKEKVSKRTKRTKHNKCMNHLFFVAVKQRKRYKGLEFDQSKSPPAQEHLTTFLNFH